MKEFESPRKKESQEPQKKPEKLVPKESQVRSIFAAIPAEQSKKNITQDLSEISEQRKNKVTSFVDSSLMQPDSPQMLRNPVEETRIVAEFRSWEPEELEFLADTLRNGMKQDADESVWTDERKYGAEKIFSRLPPWIQIEAKRKWRDRAHELALEGKVTGDIVRILTKEDYQTREGHKVSRQRVSDYLSSKRKGGEAQLQRKTDWHDRAKELAELAPVDREIVLAEEGYTTRYGTQVSAERITNYLSKQRGKGEKFPPPVDPKILLKKEVEQRELPWHKRAKELSSIPPAERARILAEEGYTTRDGNPISETRINVYLSGERKKGKALPMSESPWHGRANELREAGLSAPEIAKTLAEEGHQTTRKTPISVNALYVYFSRKKSEEEGN
jgi:hypothetical protein